MRVIIKRSDGQTTEQIIFNVAKSLTIGELKDKIKTEWDLDPESQRLFFGGKILDAANTLLDYGVDNDKVIQLAIKQDVAETSSPPREASPEDPQLMGFANEKLENPQEEEEEIESEFYTKNDLIDCMHVETGAWFEAFFLKAIKRSSGVTCKVKFCHADEAHETLERNLRPRARQVLDLKDLRPGDMIMVNHNIAEPYKIGLWYDFEFSSSARKRKHLMLQGHLYNESETKVKKEIRLNCEIYAIETPKRIGERDDELYKDDGKRRRLMPYCDTCNDDSNLVCRDCGCSICTKKENEDQILVCDECDDFFHIYCLTPPLTNIPEDDYWYCPKCALNRNEIVHEGDKLKKSKKERPADKIKTKSSKNWGGGYACVGLREKCDLPPNHRGHIPGVEVGTSWLYRFQVSETGVHRPPVCGIHGRENDCAYSLVLAGGYEDDYDYGDSFDYTGAGGRDLSGNKRTNKQSFDQKLTRDNKALALNCHAELDESIGASAKDWRRGIPVRVVRSHKMLQKHKDNKYAPKEGYRYDGIYKVVSYRPVKGQSGFIVWRYKLQRDDPTPAPWTKEGKHRIKKLGLTMQYPTEDHAIKRKASDSRDELPVKKKKLKGYELPRNVLALIKKDEPNKKRWMDLNSHLQEGQVAYNKLIRDAFTCPCCQSVVYQPVTTPCQHNICSLCLKGAWSHKYTNCPVCRNDLPENFHNSEINLILHEILLQLHVVHAQQKKSSKRK